MPDDKKLKEKKIRQKMLQGAAAEGIGRFGSAVKAHLVSFSGKDNETGEMAKRSLKSVSQSKVNPKYEEINKKQQAGFSAEIKATARKNADAIIEGKKSRTTRTDDMPPTVDSQGRHLGGTNDQLFDLAEIDANGVYIEGTARQMKFVGSNPEECAQKLLQVKYDKYRDAGVAIEIPEDFYDGVTDILDAKIKKLNKQIERNELDGKLEVVAEKKAELEKIKKTRDSLKKSNVTNKEAMEARINPRLSVAKDVAKVANQVGLEQAKIGAIISGSVSIIKNTVACIKGEIKPEDAAIEVIKDTGTGAAFSYATAFSGAVVKGVMQNATSEYVRALSNTTLASGLVSTTVNIGKTMKMYICHEINGAECIEQLGEQGVGELGAAFYSSIALSAVQGTGSTALMTVAGLAGSTLGYAAATAVYKELSTSLKEYELAKNERMLIEAECNEAIELICQYRKEMNEQVERYLSEYHTTFQEGFSSLDNAIIHNDIDGYISGNVRIQKLLGHEIQFSSQDEFDDLMQSEDSFIL